MSRVSLTSKQASLAITTISLRKIGCISRKGEKELKYSIIGVSEKNLKLYTDEKYF